MLDCFDNKGKTADRWTVIFGKEFMLKYEGVHWLSLIDMSENPCHPQGVGMSGSYEAYKIANFRYRQKHYRVRWQDLPELVKQCVAHWAEEAEPS